MNFPKDLMYATKIWLLSVFLAPLLLALGMMLFSNHYDSQAKMFEEMLGFYLLCTVYGGIFSLPSWLAFMLAARLTGRKTELEMKRKKMIMQLVALILSILPFAVLFGISEGMAWAIPYIITLSFGIWFFDWQPEESEPPTIIDHLID